MALVLDNKYDIGEVVYLKTDVDQVPRIVYAFKVFKKEMVYCLCAGTTISEHYDFEISPEKNLVINA